MAALQYKAANISDSLLSKISAMGATYPFVTLTIHDGGDLFRLTSFSGPPDIERLLTKKYTSRRRPCSDGPIGYKYDQSEEFNSFNLVQNSPGKRGSRLVAIRVWSHKYIHGLQLQYRNPKALPELPVTAEDLWKRLDARKGEETFEDIPEKQKKEWEEVDDRFWETPVYGSDKEPQAKMTEFNLGDNEYVTEVEVRYTAVIMGLILHTSSGRSINVGNTTGGSYHKFTAFPSSAIVGLHGLFGPWGDHDSVHIHNFGITTEEIDPEIEGDCEVLRLLGNYTYRLKEVIPMSENKRFYIFKFQDLDDRAIQRKECLV